MVQSVSFPLSSAIVRIAAPCKRKVAFLRMPFCDQFPNLRHQFVRNTHYGFRGLYCRPILHHSIIHGLLFVMREYSSHFFFIPIGWKPGVAHCCFSLTNTLPGSGSETLLPSPVQSLPVSTMALTRCYSQTDSLIAHPPHRRRQVATLKNRCTTHSATYSSRPRQRPTANNQPPSVTIKVSPWAPPA
jgi:hypothetical protein